MSKNRFMLSAILTLACFVPLCAQTAIDGPGVTVETGGAILHRSSVMYPDGARRARISGVVTVEATVDNTGNVVDTRVLSGPIELRRAAQQAILNWHFAMDTSMNTRQVKVNFQLPDPSTAPVEASSTSTDPAARAVFEERLKALQAQAQANGQRVTIFPTAASLEGKRVDRIYIGGLTEQGRKDLLSHLPVREGDTLAADSREKIAAAVRAYDEHLTLGTAVNSYGDVSVTIQVPGFSASGDNLSAASGSVPPPADGTKRITIGGNVQQAKLVSQPRPVYPPLAKQARIQGVVRLQAVIGKEGNITNLSVVSGHPLLVPAAIDAVKLWVYQKTLLNGDPVEVLTQIDVNFTLSDTPIQQ